MINREEEILKLKSLIKKYEAEMDSKTGIFLVGYHKKIKQLRVEIEHLEGNENAIEAYYRKYNGDIK